MEELRPNNINKRAVITHFLIWLLYLLMQFVWRFESYTIYDIIAATLQVITWAIIFYLVRLYLYPKYLWKNHWKLALAFILIYIVFLKVTITYADYLIGLSGGDGPTIIPVEKHMRRSFFWLFNMSFVAFGFTYYDELGKEKLKNQIAETQLKETQLKLKNAELENLKAQLDPHFLFNVMWYVITLIQSDEKAVKAMRILHEMMRYSMEKRGVMDLVPLSEELKYAKNFIDLQILRTPAMKLDYRVEEKEIEGIKILPLVLMSFIENAVKHGKSDEKENPLMVYLTVEPNKSFTFLVKNKISAMGKEWSSGIGLENTISRLNRTYGNKHSLVTENDGETYITKLTIET